MAIGSITEDVRRHLFTKIKSGLEAEYPGIRLHFENAPVVKDPSRSTYVLVSDITKSLNLLNIGQNKTYRLLGSLWVMGVTGLEKGTKQTRLYLSAVEKIFVDYNAKVADLGLVYVDGFEYVPLSLKSGVYTTSLLVNYQVITTCV